ncbi:hypothetical protein [Paenibacillus rhizoplanae]|uniref:hypothetical protein n=1 Tax=Paenibacillus rhizoplanae TaxID=1917181 RepID=UPI0036073AF9
MKKILTGIRKGYGKKLVSIHLWNAWLVLILAVSGLMLVGGFWRELLGEGRVWLKWGHIGFGLALLIPVVYYLLLAAKHWKRLKGKTAQSQCPLCAYAFDRLADLRGCTLAVQARRA